jgi:hypothetical protein
MSTTGSVNINLSVTETLALNSGAATDPKIQHGISNQAVNYGPTTTIVPTKVWSGTVSLSSGALTLDMTALARSPLATVDLTGLEILAVHAKAVDTNSAFVTMAPGASNGYSSLGLGVKLPASNEVLFHCPAGVAVDSTHKTLDFASTHLTAQMEIVIWANTP